MNEKQIQAAREDMLKWLTDPHELGKMPYKIELAGEFDVHGNQSLLDGTSKEIHSAAVTNSDSPNQN